ncbi:acetylserotonin O-methyltransferase [Streptomyces sp. UNOB3_S3]|uniref:acetylserotonin O-methyltransferase n=1 Tax=Streptomyces sp. UNOB3_S3 TaxID=2871682 RepID=UPI001E497286|nr:acetylserotonin O-methyltransferase [Streptomyces sp. UNOB3_S3]MCC3774456.1 methyltransferase domain-containing protein [Streptomyces sp. UNOB3_S3]
MSATSPDALLRIASGFMTSKVLLTATTLGLFTELADRPLTADELRARLSLHPRSTHDFLDTLVALGLLERVDGTYANTPATARYLVRGNPTYLGALLEMSDARMYEIWGRLETALRTGEPQNEIKSGDEDMYATLYADPERLASFQQAMTGLSMGSVLALVDAVDWSPYRTVADIGCAEGFLLTELLRRHPHLRGTGFDLAVAAPGFQRRLAESGLADRLVFRTGDFFTEPLPQADVLIFGHVLSNWALPIPRTLLRKAHEALPDGGIVVIYETLLDDDRRENVDGLLMSLTMLLETPGGFEYTGADCRGWLADAGFRESHVRHLAGPESMVIGRK